MAQLYPQAPGSHFSRLLRHAWVTVGLFLFPGHHTGKELIQGSLKSLNLLKQTNKLTQNEFKQ
jgi:hypothetical protein